MRRARTRSLSVSSTCVFFSSSLLFGFSFASRVGSTGRTPVFKCISKGFIRVVIPVGKEMGLSGERRSVTHLPRFRLSPVMRTVSVKFVLLRRPCEERRNACLFSAPGCSYSSLTGTVPAALSYAHKYRYAYHFSSVAGVWCFGQRRSHRILRR